MFPESLQAVVGGLALSPLQIPVECRGLHIIHVIEDKLCVWNPTVETRAELSSRDAQLTIVSAYGMRDAKDCVGTSFHSYCNFVLHHDRLPKIQCDQTLPLRHVLATMPVDIFSDNGSMVFLLLGWAVASGSLPGGLPALSAAVKHALHTSHDNGIEAFQTVLTDMLCSTSLPGCVQQTCVTRSRRKRNPVVGSVAGPFDVDALRSSLKSLLRDVRPENLTFLLDVALPWMAAQKDSFEFRDNGQMSWSSHSQPVHGTFELLSGRLGPKTGVLRLFFFGAKQSLWASWQNAQPGFFSGQMIHGTFGVHDQMYHISGVVIQVARVAKSKEIPDNMGHAAVSVLTVLSQLQLVDDPFHHDDVWTDLLMSPNNNFVLTRYYKENTKIVAEPRFKLLKLDDSLLRHVFGCDLPQRPAGNLSEHPKFGKAAAMGFNWFQAHRHAILYHSQIMLQVSFNKFSDLVDLVQGPNSDPVFAAVWSPLSHLGRAFAETFWKFLLQLDSTLLLGLTCILSHWNPGHDINYFFCEFVRVSMDCFVMNSC